MKTNAKTFEFTKYVFEPKKKTATFYYKITFTENRTPLHFKETLLLPKTPNLKRVSPKLLKILLRDLHLVLGISYYKTFCPPAIKLRYILNKTEANIFNEIYKKGLGEFYYRNQLDIQKAPKFPVKKSGRAGEYQISTKKRALVGLGGGKDSIVALELLKNQREDITAFIVETGKNAYLQEKITEQANVKKLKIKRVLDKKLLDGTLKNAFEGHVPISAIIAFLGFFTAILYDYAWIVVGNENSSNQGNIRYKNTIINHQWSKTSEFENLFQNYIQKLVGDSVKYFSLLRPFSELRIAEMFTKFKEYFPYFSSCNQNFKVVGNKKGPIWCCVCAKCAFTYLILSPFLTKKELKNIFGKNLFQKKELIKTYKNILGLGGLKPFDCVGTFEESQTALLNINPILKNDLVPKQLLKNSIQNSKEVLQTSPATNIPHQLCFSGMKNILLLGYGREGKTTHEYLKKNFPNIKIGIADQKKDQGYLKKQSEYDFIIKTPGIPKYKVNRPYTTATNLFFAQNRNRVIGITGTKGKGTTSQLIYTILKTAGVKTSLLGNMGNPMLEKINKKADWFVIELSSYQLDDIAFSPHIAVVLNLFQDHMNYHGDIKKYHNAKKNITNFQRAGDYFVYNSRFPKLESWSKATQAQSIPYKMCQKPYDSQLLGRHSQENIAAVIAVADILKIDKRLVLKTIKNFKPLEHRLEYVGTMQNIKFYNDAASTTPESTIAAIKTLKNIGTILLGGEDRGYDFRKLEHAISTHKIDNAILFPETGHRLLRSNKQIKKFKTSNMKEAMRFALKNTPKNKICLLSTAAPSYTLWENLEEKGKEFKKELRKYDQPTP